MTQFNQFKDRNDLDVYVNPDHVIYVTTKRNEPGTMTFIYFVGGTELAVKEEVSHVASALAKPD
jgi:hypothetical protein